MNKVILIGRLTKDPMVEQTTNKEGETISFGRYTLAVDRKGNGTDFISCVTFGKTAEFVKNYLRKGTKIAVEGYIRTDSYTNKQGQKVYTTDVVVERHEFCESKPDQNTTPEPGFMDVPEGIEQNLPFK